jgi:hypothetical protein
MSLEYIKTLDALAILAAAMANAVDCGENAINIEEVRCVIDAVCPYQTVLEQIESMDGWSLDRTRNVFWELALTFEPSKVLSTYPRGGRRI